jgi:uncharacterized protein (TIGR01777 family)
MGKVVIAGGAGLIGNALAGHLLDQGDDPVILSRRPAVGPYRTVDWDPHTLGHWAAELEGAKAVVNLCGAPISMKWTVANRWKILESRVQSTTILSAAIRTASEPPPVWINGSATGYYGDRGDELLDEVSSLGTGFLADVCRDWEEAATTHDLPATRLVLIRTGVVLSRTGGALDPLRKITNLFLGGAAGSGGQWMSWIHLQDIVRLLTWSIETEIEGPVNGCSPSPVTNHELMERLRRLAHRPWSPPAPGIALSIANLLGGPDPSLLLGSTRAIPARALETGFSFKFPGLAEALADTW